MEPLVYRNFGVLAGQRWFERADGALDVPDGTALVPAGSTCWTPLSPDSLPPPDRPLLVTNNIGSRLANGQMSMLWLVWSVHYTPPRGLSMREEFYAYTREGELVRWLTHWRLAVPEEG